MIIQEGASTLLGFVRPGILLAKLPVSKLNEVAKIHFLMPLDSDPAFLIMNKTSWDRLKGRGHFAANRPGNPVAITGIQEMANVPRKIASNAGNTDTAT